MRCLSFFSWSGLVCSGECCIRERRAVTTKTVAGISLNDFLVVTLKQLTMKQYFSPTAKINHSSTLVCRSLKMRRRSFSSMSCWLRWAECLEQKDGHGNDRVGGWHIVGYIGARLAGGEDGHCSHWATSPHPPPPPVGILGIVVYIWLALHPSAWLSTTPAVSHIHNLSHSLFTQVL